MDELEIRIFALELVVEHLLASFFDKGELVEAIKRLEPPEGADPDEKTVRIQAINLIENAMRRDEPFTPGLRL